MSLPESRTGHESFQWLGRRKPKMPEERTGHQTFHHLSQPDDAQDPLQLELILTPIHPEPVS